MGKPSQLWREDRTDMITFSIEYISSPQWNKSLTILNTEVKNNVESLLKQESLCIDEH